MMIVLGIVILIIYAVAAYISWNYLFEEYALLGSIGDVLAIKIIVPLAFGVILIPIALI